jgi:hypothetical protein
MSDTAPPAPQASLAPQAGLEARRALQLVLAAVWLLDGLLQYQPFMFGKAFGQSLGVTAPGNPGFLARPITWDATLAEHHAVLLNVIFATIQLLLGLGIAFRPTARLALGASIAWSLAVWWLGEGLGGVLNSTANPFTGAPGAVIVYALLAVILWPSGREQAHSPFVAARAIGPSIARVLWAVLWLSFAYFALIPENRAPQALSQTLAGQVSGEPGWVGAIERHSAALIGQQGLATSIVFAVAFVLIAVGVFLPRPYARAAVILALVVSAVIWVVGEAFGMILASGATDPNTGPLLALLCLSYWPVRSAVPARPAVAPAAEDTVAAMAAAEPAAPEPAAPAALEGNPA